MIENSDNSAVGTDNIPKAKSFAISVDSSNIDIAITNFSNRLFIIISQFGKLGSLINVERSKAIDNFDDGHVYEIRTLFGDDRLEYHVISRTLAESIGTEKPVLFSIALKDVSAPTIQAIRRAILENKNW